MRIIVVSGMPGAGKSVVTDAFRSAGYEVLVMGDVIREESRRRGLEPNAENTRTIMLELRAQDGPGAVAKRCVEAILSRATDTVVIEGCRSVAELDVFSSLTDDITVISVHASPATRFQRLQARARRDAPLDWTSFRERDLREISVGIGGVIALSDVLLVNESTLESFNELVARTITELTRDEN
ncbi:MAG: flagellar hook-basal body complex protein FliE [Candidatus Thorarchaeota archaeon]|nr:flagellar hook-basal body complex protein FliE [Candidatus Thorarchaeota archaeon]